MNEDIIIWAMCPYCENEVELYGTKHTACPLCGAHFDPSKEEIRESLNNQ
jgi:predicted amidophosphoribosyltransferase